MFAKLLKHEWRSTREMLGILCLISLGASLLGGLTMCYLFYVNSHDGGGSNALEILSVLFMIAAMIALAVVGAAAVLVYMGRFYKSRFTDEGYLTFTLPVNTHQNLLASLVNTAIGMVLITLVICLSGCLWMVIAFAGVEGFYQTVREHFPELWEKFWSLVQTHAGEIPWGVVARGMLCALTGAINSLVMLMLAVTNISEATVLSQLLGAAIVFGAQMLIALCGKKRMGIGGADIKLSTAAALLLGFYKGVIGFVLGLLIAVVAQLIMTHRKKEQRTQPFALLPYLSVGLWIGYLI